MSDTALYVFALTSSVMLPLIIFGYEIISFKVIIGATLGYAFICTLVFGFTATAGV